MIGWAAASQVTSTASLPPAPHTSKQYILALLSFEMCFLQILKYATTLWKATPFKNKFHSNVHKSRIQEPREMVEILQHSFSPTFLQPGGSFSLQILIREWGLRSCISYNDGEAAGAEIMLWED